MQSGLPSQLLAQIWNLADLNHDGKMDKKEFSIAMQLIKNKLKGFNIPPTLPDSMKIDPDPMIGTFGPSTMAPVVPLSGIQSAAGGMASIGGLAGIAPVRPMGMPMAIPGMVPGTMGYGGSLGSSPVASVGPLIGNSPQRPASALAKPNIDWSMSQGTKLKFSQMFNNLDKQRVGSITGAHARNIMSSSGLPPTILAQIWNLSDLDKDGKLTCDEFCIAMHLIEMAKAGETNFPATTPLELIPPSRQRTISTASVGSVGDNAGGAGLADLMGGALDDIEQKRAEAMAAVSFEDKRRLNFEKGQMELERRRQMLQEQERREREERSGVFSGMFIFGQLFCLLFRERKEREEQEKRDRERMEIERRRQLEREKELARMRELEQQKAEEYQKMMEQREAARRDLERQRQLEWEKQRIQELTAQRQRDQEAVCHLKQKQKNLTFQLQALNEKSAEVNGQITQMRDKIIAITSGIEQMKEGRDRKVADITLLQRQVSRYSDTGIFINALFIYHFTYSAARTKN